MRPLGEPLDGGIEFLVERAIIARSILALSASDVVGLSFFGYGDCGSYSIISCTAFAEFSSLSFDASFKAESMPEMTPARIEWNAMTYGTAWTAIRRPSRAVHMP